MTKHKALTTLLILPTVASAAAVAVVIERCAGIWVLAVLCGLWLLVGIGLFNAAWFHPNRSTLAEVFGFRPPIGREVDLLAAAWANVSRRPGVDGWGYSLWIEQSSELNAFAAPARIIGVTSWAAATLPRRQLEAVLAHEYGHHIETGARSQLLTLWAALPSLLVQGLAGLPGRLIVARGIAAPMDGIVRGTSAISMLAATAWLLTPPAGWLAALAAILLVIEPLTTAARRRRAEFRADAIAVDLGYGQELAASMRRWRDQLEPEGSVSASITRWFENHPPTRDRLRAIALRAPQ